VDLQHRADRRAPGGNIATLASRWFDENARDLPWRRADAGAWAILVSEVMLQQTPVARVEPVWHAWLARWATPAALAQEAPAEAIRAWGRLGYPRRALRLHECATAIVARHGGAVPSDVAALLALPGIGAYTARAVAAFAFRQRQPVVDTNVRRLLARAVDGRADAGPATTAGDLAAALALLPASGPAAAKASVAFMELGALVCTARSPRCHDCPLWTSCAWRLAGSPAGTGPRRRPQRYAGTDRQVRGLLMAVLRESTEPVPRTRLDLVWPERVQRTRALAGLVEDGLVTALPGECYALPAS
jgi:A/G-specific adenine glycosylase